MMQATFTMTAKDLMTTELVLARPNMSSRQLECLFMENGISGAPVVDEQGEMIGVITLMDIIASGDKLPLDIFHYYREVLELNALLGEKPEMDISDGFVADYMTREVFTAFPDTPVDALARAMYRERIHRLIIVNKLNRKPVGIVTTFDLLKILAEDGIADPSIVTD